MNHAAAIVIVFGVSGCADTGLSSPAQTDTSSAVYSPPVRLGGRGGMIFLPPSSSPKLAERPTSLETPDRSPRRPTADWLQGTWLIDATPEDRSRDRCNSGTTARYYADGTTRYFGDRGRWKLEGDKLTETIVEVFESGDPEHIAEIGKPHTVQIQRLGPDEGAIRSDDGWQPMLRCRSGDMK